MIKYYAISANGTQLTNDPTSAQWIRLQDPSQEEIYEIIDTYKLPDGLFIMEDYPDEVSRYEKIYSQDHDSLAELVLFNLNHDEHLPMEDQLQPISFIFSENFVISCANQGSETIDTFLDENHHHIYSVELFIIHIIHFIYHHFAFELDTMKRVIDRLDQNARVTTKNEELFLLADTERELVYLDHTLEDQALALKNLWNDEAFIQRANNPSLVYDVKLVQRHVDKKIRIYRDLLKSIGGLFSDIMSNRLNNLMKYLDTLGLIISIPTLISGIWGMNNHVPGQDTTQGFWAVMIFAAIVTIVFSLFIKNKKF